jgi:hypothetical protein
MEMAFICQEDAPEGDYYPLESGLFSVSVQLWITGRSRECLRKEYARFLAIKFICLICIFLERRFRFDKSAAVEKERRYHDEDYDYLYRGGHHNFI